MPRQSELTTIAFDVYLSHSVGSHYKLLLGPNGSVVREICMRCILVNDSGNRPDMY